MFLQTYTSSSRSSHVVSLQPEVLITNKVCLISKHIGNDPSIAAPFHFSNISSLWSWVQLKHTYCLQCCQSIDCIIKSMWEMIKPTSRYYSKDKTFSSIHPSIHPHTLQIKGLFSLAQPISLWSFSGNCLVLLQWIQWQLCAPLPLRCELWLHGPDLKPTSSDISLM